MAGWETQIRTGNPQTDQATVEQHRQAAQAQGLVLQVNPLPGGGYHVKAGAPEAQPQQPQVQQFNAQQYQPMGGYGAPPQPTAYSQAQSAYQQQPAQAHAFNAQAAYAGAGGPAFGGVVVGGPGTAEGIDAPPLGKERIAYIRKVYLLLSSAVAVAVITGIVMLASPEVRTAVPGMTRPVLIPMLVAPFFAAPILQWFAYGALFLSVMVASWTVHVKGVNIAMLMVVGALIGVDMCSMIFAATYNAHQHITMVQSPVLGAFLMVGGIFAGATAYTFIARKDFSYLGSFISMGMPIIFIGCLLTFVFQAEIFVLAICTAGALLSGAMLLYRTSKIMNGPMNDAVGDALGFLITLRNLFMFILRILMSSRR